MFILYTLNQMSLKKTFLALSLISYSLILFQGMILSFPLLLVLFFWLFDFHSISPLFSVLGLSGIFLGMAFRNKSGWKVALINIIVFGLLSAPLVWRLMSVPLALFNNWGFYIPTIAFVIFFWIFVFCPHASVPQDYFWFISMQVSDRAIFSNQFLNIEFPGHSMHFK